MLRVVAAALSAAAAAAESNRTASRLGRLQDIDDWLSNARGGPPRHWRVRSPADVSGNSTALVESYQKEVNISRLAGSAAPVVVKALQNAGAFAFGHRESDIAYFELLYLEWLRGEPGIPWLWGGWTTPSRVVWVVSHGGDRVGTGKALGAAPTSPGLRAARAERPSTSPGPGSAASAASPNGAASC
ncbi:hypothetical protein JL721_7629 [Aureococcus anophagefferens]|nr:hypothetical protein JL721_7629 [Aureococcus anophagefferens]